MADAIDHAMVSKLMNAISPVAASAAPKAWTALGGSAMKLRLDSTLATPGAAGTELTGTGYTAGGTAFAVQCDESTGGGDITVPKTTAFEWTNGSGGDWTIRSFDITDSAGLRTWFGAFNGQPITVANGNKFQIAVAGITLQMS